MSATVTDHAVLRYAERVLGIDVPAIRAALAPAHPGGVADTWLIEEMRLFHGLNPEAVRREIRAIVARGAAAGARSVLHEGARYVLNRTGGAVVTVTLGHTRARPPRRRRYREAAE